MINHARTLLLNRSGGNQSLYELGEEYIPEYFNAQILPVWIRAYWNVLFGSNPENTYRNWMVDRLLRIVHATDYGGYLLAFDPRITYELSVAGPFANTPYVFTWGERLASGSASTSIIESVDRLGELVADDKTGVMQAVWHVDLSNGEATITNMRTRDQSVVDAFTGQAVSKPLSLPGSSLRFTFRCNTTTKSEWDALLRLAVTLEPRTDLSETVAALEQLRSHTSDLFGHTAEEPYLTFFGLWQQDVLPDKIAGLVLATIYRMEEIRNAATSFSPFWDGSRSASEEDAEPESEPSIIYVNSLSVVEETNEYHLWQHMEYSDVIPDTHRLWQVDIYADGYSAADPGEWHWLGVVGSELIERDDDGTNGACITDVVDAADWDETHVTAAIVDRTYGANDEHAHEHGSETFRHVAVTGAAGDYVTVNITAEEGDCIDLQWRGSGMGYQPTVQITVTLLGEDVPLTGRGFDSQTLTARLQASPTLGSRNCVRPWNADQDVLPFDWRYGANHRLEILRNCVAGTYTIKLEQRTEVDSSWGLAWGRVLARKPGAGWLNPNSSHVVPRFMEYDPWRTYAGHYENRCLSLEVGGSHDTATKLQETGNGEDATNFWGGTAHSTGAGATQDFYDVGATAQFLVMTGGEYVEAEWVAGFQGPYTGIKIITSESANAHADTKVRASGDCIVELVQTIADRKRSVVATHTFSANDAGQYGIHRAYLAQLSINRRTRRPLDGDDVTRTLEPTTYEFRTASTPGMPVALPYIGPSDQGHFEDHYVLAFGNVVHTENQRLFIHKLLSVIGGNYATNTEQRYVLGGGLSNKMFTTVVESSDVAADEVFSAAWETFFAGTDYFD